MTVTRNARPRRRSVLATMVAVLAAVAGLAPGALADDEVGGARLRLIERTPWVEPDGRYEVVVRVDRIPPGARLRVTLHDALRGRFEFADSLDRTRLGPVRARVVDAPIDDLDRPAPDTVRVIVATGPADDDPGAPPSVRLPGPGVHPVEVLVTDADDRELAVLVTHLVRLPAEVDHAVGVVTVVDLTAPPVRRPDGSTLVDPDARARLTLVRRALDEVPDAVLTAPVTGDTLEALAAGAELDAALVDGLTAHVAADRLELTTSGWVRPNPASLDEAGLAELAEAQLDRGDAAVAAVLGRSPDRRTAVTVDQPGTAELEGLARRGLTHVVVPSGSLPPLDPNRFITSLAQPFTAVTAGGADLLALATDPGLQDRVAGDDPVLAAHHALAELGSVYFDRPAYRRALAVVLPDPVTAPALLPIWLDGITTSPLLRADGIVGAIETADPAASGGTDAPVATPDDRLVRSLLAEVRPGALAGYRDDVDLTLLGMIGLASMFPDATGIHTGLQDRLETSSAAGLSPAQRSAHLAGISADIRERAASVSLEGGRTITLAARDGTLPLVLRNDADEAARVAVELRSDKLEFPGGSRLELELEPGTTSLELEVRARASGTFPLDLEIRSPDGLLEVAEARYTIRSTAVSGLGIVLGVAAGAVLLAWWVRTARRAHRRTTTTIGGHHSEGDTT